MFFQSVVSNQTERNIKMMRVTLLLLLTIFSITCKPLGVLADRQCVGSWCPDVINCHQSWRAQSPTMQNCHGSQCNANSQVQFSFLDLLFCSTPAPLASTSSPLTSTPSPLTMSGLPVWNCHGSQCNANKIQNKNCIFSQCGGN